ncbi:hypothetical protein ATANTOWER_021187 [Ataeniobius toweri]|uniref:Uncharacterized protein n=1 Tax=Ataeniobius toweri TaxID=208326 RepID=A0ABU7CKA0_9TELE|nr:hypothetical protein [Ataeniobius toweri]
MFPGVSGLWFHGWFCCSVDSCRQGLWARRCSSVGLLHCGSWVVPLWLSSVLLWGFAIIPAVVLPGSPCSGGPLDICGSDLLHVCPGSRGHPTQANLKVTMRFCGSVGSCQTLCSTTAESALIQTVQTRLSLCMAT